MIAILIARTLIIFFFGGYVDLQASREAGLGNLMNQ